MFMGNDECINIFGVNAEPLQASFAIRGGKTAVNQQPRGAVFHDQRITTAAATETGETHAAYSVSINDYDFCPGPPSRVYTGNGRTLSLPPSAGRTRALPRCVT